MVYMVNVDLYSAIITKVSNALNTLVSVEKPGFQTLSKRLVVLLCSEVVRHWYCHVAGHWLSSGPWQESGPIWAFVVIPHQADGSLTAGIWARLLLLLLSTI